MVLVSENAFSETSKTLPVYSKATQKIVPFLAKYNETKMTTCMQIHMYACHTEICWTNVTYTIHKHATKRERQLETL